MNKDDERTRISATEATIYLTDPSGRVVGRIGKTIADSGDFLVFINERGLREHVNKANVLRIVEGSVQQGGFSDEKL